MKEKRKKSTKLATVTESDLLTLVANKLRGRELFPEKTEAARRLLKKIKGAKV